MPFQTPISKDLKRLLAFGSGVGLEIGDRDLEIVAVRVRPSGVKVSGRLTIANYAARPAAEWGAEYARFLKSLGAAHLSATVLLPRRDAIVRHVSLPGVSAKDLESAIRFQLDTLHPYGDDDIAWGWSPLAYGAVLVGVVRRQTMERYHRLFTEAGIAVSCLTFSAAAVHAAVRLNGGTSPDGFVAFSPSASGGVEVYGESPARPVFSAELPEQQRAVLAALSELRLPPGTEPLPLAEILPKPSVNPVENDLSRNPRPYATALAGACPRLARAANVLPLEYRRLNSRTVFLPTLVIAAVLLLGFGAALGWSKYGERQYLKRLEAEIARVEPNALRAGALERQVAQSRARAELLDQFRSQTRVDMEALQELTRIIEPPAWTNTIDLTRDNARVSGEAPQAAQLLKILDSSPLFDNSAPDSIVPSPSGKGEAFQIRTTREKRK